jgi:hypothetical protein
VAALAEVVAHGGIGGAIVESAVAVTVAAVLIAVWARERRVSKEERATSEPARLRDDD